MFTDQRCSLCPATTTAAAVSPARAGMSRSLELACGLQKRRRRKIDDFCLMKDHPLIHVGGVSFERKQFEIRNKMAGSGHLKSHDISLSRDRLFSRSCSSFFGISRGQADKQDAEMGCVASSLEGVDSQKQTLKKLNHKSSARTKI